MNKLACSRSGYQVYGGSNSRCSRFDFYRFSRGGLLAVWFVLLLPFIQAGKTGTTASKPVFPVSGLEREVSFWKTVFTQYERNDVLIHDSKDIFLIYEVLKVQGNYEQNASILRAQNAAITSCVKHWKNLLSDLSGKIRKQQELTQAESAFLRKMQSTLNREPSWTEIERLSDQIHVQRGNREMFTAGWIRSGQYYPHMLEIFQRMEVPTEILALPYFESSFIPVSRSNKGATGVWQFIRSTGKHFLTIDRHFDQRLDPLQATWGAARYLLDAYRRLDSWPLAVMSYNHGTNGICKAKERVGNDPVRIIRYYSSDLFGFSSRNYYPEFLAALEVITNPETFFPGLKQADKWQFQEVRLTQPIPAATLMKQSNLSDHHLRLYNPSIRSDTATTKLVLPAGFNLRLPPAAPRTVYENTSESQNNSSPPAGSPITERKPARSDSKPDREDKKGVTIHIVAPQETLYRIAKNYRVSVAQLQQWNNLKGLRIQIGQKLVIRGGIKN